MSTITNFEKDRQVQNREINQKRMWKLKQQPCTDCELRWHPHCMSFDHIDRTGMHDFRALM